MYTNSQIREAFHKAADCFDRHPERYQYMETQVPECGSPGCMIGMVGLFLGVPAGRSCWLSGATSIIGVPSRTFVQWREEWHAGRDYCGLVTRDASLASAFMRWVADTKYADEGQAEQYPEIRDELTRIFNKEPAWTAS